MMTAWAVLGGFELDAIFGDPSWLPHPVVYMGKAISRLEKFLRARLPKTPQGELLGGAPLALTYKAINTLDTVLGCSRALSAGARRCFTRCWGWPSRCSGAGRRWPQRDWCRRARMSMPS